MKAKDVKWCPQHGYPLPCDKCGMPLSQTQQRDIYKAGKIEGIRLYSKWLKEKLVDGKGDELEAKLKEWRIE